MIQNWQEMQIGSFKLKTEKLRGKNMKKNKLENILNRKLLMIPLMMVLLTATIYAQTSDLFTSETTATAASARSNIEVTFLSQDPDPVEPGDIVDLRFRVENYGANPIDDVSFTLELGYPFSFVEPEKRIIYLGTLGTRQKGEESAILLWRIRVDQNAVESTEEVKVSYNTDKYGVLLEPFDVRIQGRESVVSVENIQVFSR